MAATLLLLLGLVVDPVAALAAPNELDSQQTPPRALAAPTQVTAGTTTPSIAQDPEPRVALVIGNASYQSAPQLDNPDNDAHAVAQLLNAAGFEVIAATNLTQNDMIKVVQDFSSRIAAHGPNTVAMIYYAGHGVQLAGEN
jgi:ketopantoate reductase